MWRRLSTFKRGFVSTFSFDVLARGLSAVATVMFIRSLGVGSFAYVVLFLNLGQFTGSALTGGVRMRYMRVEAERVSRGKSEKTGFALAWGASMALVVAAAALCIAAASIAGVGGSHADRAVFVGVVAAFTVGNASIELAMYHHQAHLAFSRAGRIGLYRSAAILVIAAVVTAGLLDSGPAVAAWTAAAVLSVAAVACWPLVLDTWGARAAAAARGDFGRESAWLTVYYLTSAGFAYASIFVAAALLDDAAVASYGAALRYTAIVLGPTPALLAVLRIRTSQRNVVDSTEVQRGMMVNWIKRSTIPLAVVLGAAAVLAPVLIPVIDEGRYPDSIAVFQLLLVGALFICATLPSVNLLMTQRRYRLLAGVFAVALVIQVAAVALAAEIGGVVALSGATTAVQAGEASFVAYLATRVPLAAPTPEPVQ